MLFRSDLLTQFIQLVTIFFSVEGSYSYSEVKRKNSMTTNSTFSQYLHIISNTTDKSSGTDLRMNLVGVELAIFLALVLRVKITP